MLQETDGISLSFDGWPPESTGNVPCENFPWPTLDTIGQPQNHLSSVNPSQDYFSAPSEVRRPANVALRGLPVVVASQARSIASHVGWEARRADRALHGQRYHSSLAPPSSNNRMLMLHDGDHKDTGPSTSRTDSVLGIVSKTQSQPTNMGPRIPTQIQSTTFPPPAMIWNPDLRLVLPDNRSYLPPITCSHTYPCNRNPNSVDRFLSKEAEQYWKVFGESHPSLVGDVLTKVNGPQEWLTICFAVINPYIYELMRQLDALSANLAFVLSRNFPPYHSMSEAKSKVGTRYHADWRRRFDTFIDEWHFSTWDDRLDKISLLNDEYQSTIQNLHIVRQNLWFTPEHLRDELNRFDLLMGVLHIEMTKMPQIVERRAALRAEEEREGKNSTSELDLERHQRTRNTKSCRSSRVWNGCIRSRSNGAHDLLRSTRSFSNHLCDILSSCLNNAVHFACSVADTEAYGTQKAAYGIVTCLSILATAAMALAVWRCPATAALSISVTIDSNFWSTCSQMFTGLGGLYCLIIPILQRADLGVTNPEWFKALLVVSFASAIVSVIVYHFQTQVSLVMALVSGLAGLLATLMVIKDAGNRIIDQAENVKYLADEVERLRRL